MLQVTQAKPDQSIHPLSTLTGTGLSRADVGSRKGGIGSSAFHEARKCWLAGTDPISFCLNSFQLKRLYQEFAKMSLLGPRGLLCMLELYTYFSDLGCLVCTAFLGQNLKFYFLLLPLYFLPGVLLPHLSTGLVLEGPA